MSVFKNLTIIEGNGIKVKTKRQEAILKIIDMDEVCTQEILQEKLKESGFDVTQATVSRDIKSLNLIKIGLKGGNYRYAQKQDDVVEKKTMKFKSVFYEAVISVDYAQNIVAVKCHVGMGNAACAAIDMMSLGEVVGTLAGDDTIFILLKTEQKAHEFVDKLNEMLDR